MISEPVRMLCFFFLFLGLFFFDFFLFLGLLDFFLYNLRCLSNRIIRLVLDK